METNITTKDVILDKKLEDYNCKNKDFLAAGELTVTITLGEYRKLVESDATSSDARDKLFREKMELEVKVEKLKEDNEKLKSEIYELQKEAGKREATEQEKSDDWQPA